MNIKDIGKSEDTVLDTALLTDDNTRIIGTIGNILRDSDDDIFKEYSDIDRSSIITVMTKLLGDEYQRGIIKRTTLITCKNKDIEYYCNPQTGIFKNKERVIPPYLPIFDISEAMVFVVSAFCVDESLSDYEKDECAVYFFDQLQANERLKKGRLKKAESIRDAIAKAQNETLKMIERRKALHSDTNIVIASPQFINSQRKNHTINYPNGSVATKDKAKSEEKQRYKKLNEDIERLALEKEIRGFEKLILLVLINGIYQATEEKKGSIFIWNDNGELDCEAISFLKAIGKNTDKDTMQNVKNTIEGMRQKGIVLTVKDPKTGEELSVNESPFSFREYRRGRRLPIIWKFKQFSSIFFGSYEEQHYKLSIKPLLYIVQKTQAGKRQNALIDFIFHFMVEVAYSGARKIVNRKTMEDCSILTYGSRAKREFPENKKIIEEALSDYVINLTEKDYWGSLIENKE